MLLPAIVFALAAAQAAPQWKPEAEYVRTAHAARWQGPFTLDGRMDEPGWQAAPLEDSFTQASPDEGKPASVHTAFRMLWDDTYLYFGAICDDPEPPTYTLTRRDRSIEGDTVQFDLDTTLDRRTAYHFQVFAAGQQFDALHYNDTSFTSDWDAAWESAVARTPTGWAVEMRIPLRVLRIPENAHAFGLNVYRILSRRHEEDQWRFRPGGRPGDVSRFGVLLGIDGIRPVRALELRPYVGARVLRNSPAPTGAVPHAELGGCPSVGVTSEWQTGGCVGLDLRYNLASDLSLVGTVNPDFGQVEADQRVLNLTTFETFFPEKRPFFLEGLDLFKPAISYNFGGPYGGSTFQPFYSRRIGRAAPPVSLDSNQSLIYQQPNVPVLGAAKISGTVQGASVGVLTAVEPRTTAQVLTTPDAGPAHSDDLRTAEARSTSVARVRVPVRDNVLVGFTGTAVDPFLTDSTLSLDRRHAHVGGVDLVAFTPDRSLEGDLQATGSLLTGHEPETLRDGTFLGRSASGGAVNAKAHYETEYFAGELYGDYLSPTFTTNDLGFMSRANLARAVGLFWVRNPHPNPITQTSQLVLLGREVRNASLSYVLERDAVLETDITFANQWFFNAGVQAQAPYVDDRELLDGTPIERQPAISLYSAVNTDPRKRLQLQFSTFETRAFPRFERQNQLEWTLIFRPLPQLDGSLDVTYNENAGTIRQIRGAALTADPATVLNASAATLGPRQYLLATQQARSLSTTLRATYAFTPYLTLQAYAQIFTAGIAYGSPLKAVVSQAGRPTVRLEDLVPASRADLPPDSNERQAGLNVNLILRWEWRTGSTLYLVYAHQSSQDITSGVGPLDFGRELAALGGHGVALGDTLLVKIDLLSALRL